MFERKQYHALVIGVCIVLLATLTVQARAQLRVVSYNTLDKPFNATHDSQVNTIFDAIGTKSVNGIAKRVDIVSLQEQTTFSGSTTASNLADELNDLYGITSYTSTLSGFGTDRVGFVYDTATVDLITTAVIPITGSRPAYRMQFRPVGYTSTDADVYIYATHFQAGSAVSTRTTQGNFLSNNADSLGNGKNILFAGDFNFGTHTEQGYQNLLGAGDGQVFDPLNLGFWPSSFFAEHMTQSTRTAFLSDGGATGGNDDRFDLQLVSGELLDGEGLSYIGPTSTGGGGLDHSYQAFGNDGVSFNQAINNTLVGRSQPASVLNALHDFSDHLPVVADYQLPASMSAMLTSTLPGTINLNDPVSLDVLVENIANVVAEAGADELDYTLSVTGDLTGNATDTDVALGGGNTHQVTLDTASVGVKSGTITVQTASLGAANSLIEIPINFEVLGAGVTGDFDGDFDVDGDDFLVWQRTDGSSGGLADWQNNYGTGTLAAGSVAVPEPGGLLLFGGSMGFCCSLRVRRLLIA